MNGNRDVGFPRWITAEGTIDVAELPIDGILKQAIDPEFERFRSACGLLGCMAGAGGREAGLYLIGLLGFYPSDLQRLEVIAGQLGHFSHESSANALLAEIRRVRSSNTTRQYLDRPSFRSISSNRGWKASLRTLPSHQRCAPSFVTVASGLGFDRAQKNVPAGGTLRREGWRNKLERPEGSATLQLNIVQLFRRQVGPQPRPLLSRSHLSIFE